jgi:polysaccharide export outer membrane protein
MDDRILCLSSRRLRLPGRSPPWPIDPQAWFRAAAAGNDFASVRRFFLRSVFILFFTLASAILLSAQTIDPYPPQTTNGQSGSQAQPQQPPFPGVMRPPVITNPPSEVAPSAQSTSLNTERPTGEEQEEQLRKARAAEPDLEFQGFVETSIGQKLSIFGHNLFEGAGAAFTPLVHVEPPSDYPIGPGDELLIRTWGQIDVNYRAVVDRTGTIFIPRIGAFSVAGVKFRDLHDYLQREIGRYYKNFELNVTAGRLRSIQVFVVGQVVQPGSYTVSSLSTLVDALFAAGGPMKRGSMRRIQVKRNGTLVTTFDLYDLIVGGDKTKDVVLQSGDVVYVPPVGPLVALAGSVSIPAIFELKDHTQLADVVAYAGGTTAVAAGDHGLLERIDQHRARQVEEFPVNAEGLKREVKDGDVVRFLHISPRFENAVTLRGNVQVPGRYPWFSGMRVHDLIPNREFLVTNEYWRKHNELSSSGSETREARVSEFQLKNDVKRVSADINWEYAAILRIDPADLRSELLPFHLAKAIEGDPKENLQLEPNDVVTIFSQADIHVPIAQQNKFVHVEGEAREAGVYQVLPGETLRQLAQRVGGFTPEAYLYGAEFTRESTRVDQQARLDTYVNELESSIVRAGAGARALSAEETALAQQRAGGLRTLVDKMRTVRATGRIVLELKPNASGSDALPDLVLEDGDRLFIPFKPATVNVIGSVYNRNAFIYKPGKTVSDYLRLAGGATRDGDKGRSFVLRADGSTVSRQQHNFLLSRDFNTLRLMPGDTIVVPEKLDRGSTFRAIRDWSQVFTQFFLGAAAAKVLFP